MTLTPDQDAQAVLLRSQGRTQREIAETFSVGRYLEQLCVMPWKDKIRRASIQEDQEVAESGAQQPKMTALLPSRSWVIGFSLPLRYDSAYKR